MGEVDEGAEKGEMEGGDGVRSESKGVERGKRLEEVGWQALYGVVGEVEVVEALRGGEEVLRERGNASTLDPQNFQTCENIIIKKSLFWTTRFSIQYTYVLKISPVQPCSRLSGNSVTLVEVIESCSMVEFATRN